MKRWRFETNRISSVATAQPQSQNPVFYFELTWWPDLTWLWVEIFRKVAEKMGVRWVKTGGAARRRIFAILEKPEGGVQTPPPPSRARVK